MPRDRFLTGILIGIGALVILALILFFIRQSQVTYGDETTPDDVLRNYILAVQNGDYERAYGYIYTQGTSIDFIQFQKVLMDYGGQSAASTAAEIGNAQIANDGQSAVVQVTLLRGSADPFESTYRDVHTATLIKTGEGWKITEAPYPFWSGWYPAAPEKLLPTFTPTP